jgi:uncharacterized cupredoxin-like copper-binding protein
MIDDVHADAVVSARQGGGGVLRVVTAFGAIGLVMACATATVQSASAATMLTVSLWGDMAGPMPMDRGIGMAKSANAAQEAKPPMGVTIFRHTVNAGAVTFSVTNHSEKTIHEMLVVPIKDTRTALPYLGGENRVDEDKIHSLGEVSELDPGKSGSLTLKLKPGKYLLTCNVPGHYAAGMWTVLTVTP